MAGFTTLSAAAAGAFGCAAAGVALAGAEFSGLLPGGATPAAMAATGALLACAALLGRDAATMRRLALLSDADLHTRVQSGHGWLTATAAQRLSAAEESEDEADDFSALKASALVDTSACIMLADADFRIIFVNEATQALLKDNEAAIQAHVPKFRADEIIGKQMDFFHSGGNQARNHLKDPANLPFATNIQVGDLWFSLIIASARDAAGAHAGFVVEWNEVTERLRDTALRTTLEANQILCEFSPEGALRSANDNFWSVTGFPASNLSRTTFSGLLSAHEGAAPPNWDDVLKGQTSHGRYRLISDANRPAWIDGSFTAVRDSSGEAISVLLVATDVTTQEVSDQKIAAERAAAEADVAQVVDALGEALSELANGNLTVMVSSPFAPTYEPIRLSFNKALEELATAIDIVVTTVDSLQNNSLSISRSTEALSATTERQAASLEETAAALDEMTATVKSSAASAEDAKSYVASTTESARSSGRIVERAVQAMELIEDSSQKIKKIVSVIDDISFQTNLLALNAGVEAARAGDAGRGFAVVASEVRGLAHRSAENATEIRSLIDASSNNVQQGSSLVHETGDALRTIIEAMSEIDGKVSQIAQSTVEQATGINEINQVVNEFGGSNQTFAASFEETTAATQSMSADVQVLSQRLQTFKTGTERAAIARSAPVATAPKAEPQERPAPPPAQPAVQGNTALQVDGPDDDWTDF